MTNIAIAVPHGLGVQHFLSYQHLAVLVVWFLAIVDEEADTVGVEVDIRGLEELVAAATTIFLAFLQRF